jgi:hypothetical protein
VGTEVCCSSFSVRRLRLGVRSLGLNLYRLLNSVFWIHGVGICVNLCNLWLGVRSRFAVHRSGF